MNYNPRKKCIQIGIPDADRAYRFLIHALKNCRKAGDLPMGPYDRRGPLQPIDHAQSGILDAAAALGIDLGAGFHEELDLRGDEDAEVVDP